MIPAGGEHSFPGRVEAQYGQQEQCKLQGPERQHRAEVAGLHTFLHVQPAVDGIRQDKQCSTDNLYCKFLLPAIERSPLSEMFFATQLMNVVTII